MNTQIERNFANLRCSCCARTNNTQLGTSECLENVVSSQVLDAEYVETRTIEGLFISMGLQVWNSVVKFRTSVPETLDEDVHCANLYVR